MSAPLFRVYPERVERARRNPSFKWFRRSSLWVFWASPASVLPGALQYVPRILKLQITTYLEKRLVETEQTNAHLRGQLSVVAGRLQLTPDEEAEAEHIAERVRGMDARQIAKLDADLRRELSAKASAIELDTKVSSSDLEHVTAKSRREFAAVRKEIDNAKKELQATAEDLNKQLERKQNEIELLRTAGQHTDYDFALNGKGAKSTVAGVTIELQDSNLKKNQFNMTLVFGATRLVQENRSLDEPIFFYLPNDTAPMELVVDKLARHRLSGRLIVPKSSFTTASATPTHPSP
jgi:hypothetical protein